MKAYLSEEELSELIRETEEQDMITAPPGLADSLLEAVRKKERRDQREFRRYCIRVIGSVAAAIVFVFFAPFVLKQNIPSEPQGKEAFIEQEKIPEPESLKASIPDRSNVLKKDQTEAEGNIFWQLTKLGENLFK